MPAWHGNGITGAAAEEIWEKLQGFASFGFPESHSVSFAYIVYAASWLQVPLAGGVLHGTAQRPTDGVLHARTRWSRTPSITG